MCCVLCVNLHLPGQEYVTLRNSCGVNITVKNTTVVNDVDYLFFDLLHVSVHVRPSSGTLEVNYTKHTAFNSMRLTSNFVNRYWHSILSLASGGFPTLVSAKVCSTKLRFPSYQPHFLPPEKVSLISNRLLGCHRISELSLMTHTLHVPYYTIIKIRFLRLESTPHTSQRSSG
jgi:hypothetical protein